MIKDSRFFVQKPDEDELGWDEVRAAITKANPKIVDVDKKKLSEFTKVNDFFLQTNLQGTNPLLVGIMSDHGELRAVAKIKEQDDGVLGIVALAANPIGKGYGKELVNVLKSIVGEKEEYKALFCNPADTGSRKFWIRMGFVEDPPGSTNLYYRTG